MDNLNLINLTGKNIYLEQINSDAVFKLEATKPMAYVTNENIRDLHSLFKVNAIIKNECNHGSIIGLPDRKKGTIYITNEDVAKFANIVNHRNDVVCLDDIRASDATEIIAGALKWFT